MVNMVERRRYPRYAAHYDIAYKFLDNCSQNTIKHAIAEDVSRTGLKIRFNGLLKKGDILKLEIFKKIGSTRIKASGKVVWYNELPSVYGEKLAGIFLTNIGWTETDKLVSRLS